MTSECRTLIELTDITGIEFECKNCKAKILYPLQGEYKRLSEQCPNCFEPWFSKQATNPGVPTVADEVKKVFAMLHKVATSQTVLAQVRLCVAQDEQLALSRQERT